MEREGLGGAGGVEVIEEGCVVVAEAGDELLSAVEGERGLVRRLKR